VSVFSPGAKLELERSGGFAGMTLHASVPMAQLSPQEQAAVDQLVKGRNGWSGPPSGPDRFVYRLTLHGREALVQEDQVPNTLRPLLDRLSGSWSFPGR